MCVCVCVCVRERERERERECVCVCAISTIENLGYKCQFIVLVFGSLGHVHRLAVRGLWIGGLSKTRAKQLAKYCSISATIGSMFIWKRRCFLYP